MVTKLPKINLKSIYYAHKKKSTPDTTCKVASNK